MFFAVSLLGFHAIAAIWPDASNHASQVYAWLDEIESWLLLIPLVAFIIVSEEAIWRGAVMLPLAAKLGAWKGVVVSAMLFALAHVFLGPPILVFAAFVAGCFWGWLAIKTRGLFAPIVCHLLWDGLVMFVWPLV